MTETVEVASLKRTDQRDQADRVTEDRMAPATRMTSVPQRDGKTARSRIINLSPERRTAVETMTTSKITHARTAPIQKPKTMVIESMQERMTTEEMMMLVDKTMFVIEEP